MLSGKARSGANTLLTGSDTNVFHSSSVKVSNMLDSWILSGAAMRANSGTNCSTMGALQPVTEALAPFRLLDEAKGHFYLPLQCELGCSLLVEDQLLGSLGDQLNRPDEGQGDVAQPVSARDDSMG